MIYRLLFILLFLPTTPPGKKVISGRLDTNKPKDYEASLSQIVLKNKGKVIGRSNITRQGEFISTIFDRRPEQVDILYTEFGMDAEMYLQHINLTNTTDTLRLTLPIPVPVATDGAGSAICPKCNKADKTREVVSGRIQRSTYGPHWRCNRDNIFF
ncbi:hypothetical protein [Chitinophaga varians]|uniref:hypothetical protein n=1 Tax=Chitinophaga varians TaxID=2202339 RepID=UPI00165F3F09|nr:hypothetical protein [Chitinophaga varians]MBC9914967.1 hypothetical protein [Chitinophaga varians]